MGLNFCCFRGYNGFCQNYSTIFLTPTSAHLYWAKGKWNREIYSTKTLFVKFKFHKITALYGIMRRDNTSLAQLMFQYIRLLPGITEKEFQVHACSCGNVHRLCSSFPLTFLCVVSDKL